MNDEAKKIFNEDGTLKETTVLHVYKYNERNKNEYLGEENKKISKGLGLHSGITLTPPPDRSSYPKNKWPAFLNGKWEFIDDFRGTIVYNILNKHPHPIDNFGPIPPKYTPKVPKANDYKWDYAKSDWVVDENLRNATIKREVEDNWKECLSMITTRGLHGADLDEDWQRFVDESYESYVKYVENNRPEYLPKLPNRFF